MKLRLSKKLLALFLALAMVLGMSVFAMAEPDPGNELYAEFTPDVLSFDVQKEMLEAVQDGARMILTDGLMSLEKCGEYSSPIARALPVSLESPWKRPSYLKSPVARYGRGSIEVARRKE